MGGHVAAIAGKQSASLPLDRWPHTPPRNEKALLLGGVELPVRRRLRLSAADCLQRLAGGGPRRAPASSRHTGQAWAAGREQEGGGDAIRACETTAGPFDTGNSCSETGR